MKPSVRRPELVSARRRAAPLLAQGGWMIVVGGSASMAAAGCLPEETVIGPSIDAIVQSEMVTLEGGTRVSALDAVPLPDGSLLVDGMAGDQAVLVLAPRDGRSPEILGEGGEIGAVRSVASAGDVTLVVGELGVVAIENGALFRVPIEPMLETMEVRALAPLTRADGTLDFLVATDAGLFVVVGDQASPIEIGGAPLVATHLAPRPRAGDVLSAWAADESGLVRITLGEGPTEAPMLARLARLGEVEALASDDEGRPWWVEDGTLFSMTRDQRVIVRALPMPAGVAPSGLTAIAGSGELWIHGAVEGERTSSALFHFDGHVFRGVTGAIEGMTIRCATSSECLGFDGTGEMARIAVRHAASLEGLLEGASLHEPVTVHVAAEAEAEITTITADVSGTPVPVEAGELVIDPASVGFGPRTLHVTIGWSDGTLPRTLTRSFEVEAPATWAEDIEPLYRAHCADCHGAAGPSARRLDAREGWMREIDRLLPAITSGAMPLGRPRLPDASVALVRTWAAAGFP